MKNHRKTIIISIIIVLLLLIAGGTVMLNQHQTLLQSGRKGNGEITTYPFAKGMREFKEMKVYVQDSKQTQALQLYSVNTNPKRNYPTDDSLLKKAAVATFDMKGKITVAVVYPKAVKSVQVRPATADVKTKIKGKTVFFTLKKWGQYSVEMNGDSITKDLLIFANPPQEKIPASAKVIKGRVDGPLNIAQGQTVYLAAGSVIDGPVTMASDSKLLGRGILTQGGPPAINVPNADHVTIDGINIFDPNDWVVQLYNSTHVAIHNLKIISCRDNSDGITIQSSQDVTIDHSFIRSWDDSIVLKNYTNTNKQNIKVTNSLIWTDLAQSMEIGFETNKGNPLTSMKLSNVLFENIDVLHAFHKAPISIHNADNCSISNVTFKNIILEDAQMGVSGTHGEGGGWPYLIDFDNGNSEEMGGDASWTNNDGNRSIENVLVEGVWVLAGEKSSCGLRLLNEDSGGKSQMKNIQLKNIYFKKQALNFTSMINEANLAGHVSDKNSPYFSPFK
ncbi:glycosyl hydrolase family 28 protein [Lactococcus hircilactis]|uniref:glycosyl hydrolase family 28 protein n=1 Tax=Lactococcus hircilactis TaxID=1494462 RepID=UPI003FA338CF